MAIPLIGGSLIVDPNGEIVAEARTEEDELLVHPCDLDATKFGKDDDLQFRAAIAASSITA